MYRTVVYAICLCAALSSVTAIAQQEDINYTFDEGSMLLLCIAPDSEGEAGAAVFNEAFPKLVTHLQLRANEGIVIRAHYLTELNDGMFIVVGGESLEESTNNALELQAESREIISAAIESAGASGSAPEPDYCRMIPIGPLAVLPMK